MWLIFEHVLGRFGFLTWQRVLQGQGLDALTDYSWVEPKKEAFEKYNSCLRLPFLPPCLPPLSVSVLKQIPELRSCYRYIHVSLKNMDMFFKT